MSRHMQGNATHIFVVHLRRTTNCVLGAPPTASCDCGTCVNTVRPPTVSPRPWLARQRAGMAISASTATCSDGYTLVYTVSAGFGLLAANIAPTTLTPETPTRSPWSVSMVGTMSPVEKEWSGPRPQCLHATNDEQKETTPRQITNPHSHTVIVPSGQMNNQTTCTPHAPPQQVRAQPQRIPWHANSRRFWR